jgi:hypothetical protein
MRPLQSVAREYRVLGLGEVAVAVFFAVLASVLDPVEAVAGIMLGTAVAGPAVYLPFLRPRARRAIAEARPAPTDEREDPQAAVRRVAWPVAAQWVLTLAVSALARTPGLLAGIALGVGVAALLTARQIEHWQVAHGASVLREPGARARTRGGARDAGYYVERPG